MFDFAALNNDESDSDSKVVSTPSVSTLTTASGGSSEDTPRSDLTCESDSDVGDESTAAVIADLSNLLIGLAENDASDASVIQPVLTRGFFDFEDLEEVESAGAAPTSSVSFAPKETTPAASPRIKAVKVTMLDDATAEPICSSDSNTSLGTAQLSAVVGPPHVQEELSSITDKLPEAQSDSPKPLAKFWRVQDVSGIVVRNGEDVSSPIIGRLRADALVQEMRRRGNRVHYLRKVGEGPASGWVNATAAGRELLQAVSSDWRPLSTPPSSPPSPVCEPLAEAPPKQANLIFFDWDDTLCPTSWIEGRPDLRGTMIASRSLSDEKRAAIPRTGQQWYLLGQQAEAVNELVHAARALGPVALVTLAQRPWVELSVRDFMPQAGEEVLPLDVFYARETPGRSMVPGGCPWTAMKRRAMAEAFTELGKKTGNTWESLISIGDSYVEKRAAQDLGRELQSNGTIKWTKTVKLTEHPSVTQLTAQVRALKERLSELVNHQGHKHVDAKEWLKR